MPEQGRDRRHPRRKPVDERQLDRAFGEEAVASGFVTRSQVEEALKAQRTIVALGLERRLSDVMIEKGFLAAVQAETVRRAVETGGKADTVGGFELIEKLGEGGMGVVHKARQISLDRIVALKILSQRLARDRDFVARFQREAKVAAKLDHVNVVRALDVGEAGGVRYFAMEFVEGRDVGSILDEKGQMPEREALGVTLQVARALEHAWKHSLIHRDVKPDNILLTKDGVAKLTDLGLARSTEDEGTRMTIAGTAMGTPHYISPEQARGEADVDIRTDIYSLGVTLYHMLAGQPPFGGASAAVIITRRLTEDPPWVRKEAPDVSEGAALVVRKMMARDRRDRYADPSELIVDLKLVAEGKVPLAAAPEDLTVLWSKSAVERTPGPAAPAHVPEKEARAEDGRSATRVTRRVARKKAWAVAAVPIALLVAAAAGTAALLLADTGPLAELRVALFGGLTGEREAEVQKRMWEIAALAEDDFDGAMRAFDAEIERHAGTQFEQDFVQEKELLVAKGGYDEAVSEIQTLLEARRYDEARTRFFDLTKQYPGPGDHGRLRGQLTGQGWARLKIGEATDIASKLENSGQLGEALERARAARDEFGDFPGFTADLDEVIDRINGKIRARKEEEARQKRARDAKAELAVLTRLLERKEYKKIAPRGERATEKYAGTEYEEGFKRIVADAREARSKELAAAARFEALVEAAEEAVGGKRYAEAVAAYGKALEVRESDRVSRRLKDARYRMHLELSQDAEKGGDLDCAIREVREAISIAPSRKASSRLGELERRARLEKALTEAREREAAGDLETARGLYRRALAEATAAERVGIGEAADRAEREIAYATALDEANSHVAAERWVDAEHAAKRALSAKPGDPAAAALMASVRRAAEDAREKSAPSPPPDPVRTDEVEEKGVADPRPLPPPKPPPGSEPETSGSGKVPLPPPEPVPGPTAGPLPKPKGGPRSEPGGGRRREIIRHTNKLGMAFVLVPAGEYPVGSTAGQPDEQPVHTVRLHAFFMGAHEVTNAQYEQYDRRHRRRRSEFSAGDDYPAVNVSWTNASRFCEWLTKREGVTCRLPTEAEWEAAARGPGGHTYPWGDGPAYGRGVYRANWGQGEDKNAWRRDRFLYAAPVGSFPAGAGPFGCLDMAGNVWEWCHDWYAPAAYAKLPKGNPRGPRRGREKVVRGGSFANDIEIARSSNRHKLSPNSLDVTVGFRVVRELHPVKDKDVVERLRSRNELTR